MILANDGRITSLRWQLFMRQPQTGNLIGISGVQMFATVGGSNLATTPANGSTSSTGSNPGNAFDGSSATNFTSTSSTERLIYAFGSAQSIALVRVTARNDGSFAQAPTKISVCAEDEFGAWPIIASVDQLTWSQGSSVDIPVDNLIEAIRQQRIISSRFIAGALVP